MEFVQVGKLGRRSGRQVGTGVNLAIGMVKLEASVGRFGVSLMLESRLLRICGVADWL